MITTVLFDKDGTLFDFRATWSGWAASLFNELATGDVAKAAEMAGAVGFDLEAREFAEDSVLIAGTPGDIARCLLPYVPGTTAAGLISRMNVLAAAAPQQEATPLLPLLETLRSRGLRLGVITNDAVEPALAHLASAGVEGYFDRVIGCDCGYGQKPDGGQIRAFMDMTGAEPEQTVMIGDSPQDLLAARSAGCHGVGVLTGPSSRRQLLPLAAAVLPDISGLPRLIDSWTERRIVAA